MTKRFLAGVLALSMCVPALAQSTVTDISGLQGQIDSLSAVKTALSRQMEALTDEIEALQELVRRRQHEETEQADLVLVTNMEASLRLQPSPGARVLRIVPEKTPLTAMDYEGAYWKVRYQGLEGWVMRLFVDEGENAGAFKDSVAYHASEQDIPKAWQGPNRRAERMGKDLLVTSFGMHPPNSAGGVSLYYAFEHLDSTRTIREITFSVTPYNAGGLAEKGKNSGVSTRRLRRFGPITVYDGERQYQVENVWYNENIRCVQIDRVDVVFTDGSRASHGRSVQDILSRELDNDCTVPPSGAMGIAEENQ